LPPSRRLFRTVIVKLRKEVRDNIPEFDHKSDARLESRPKLNSNTIFINKSTWLAFIIPPDFYLVLFRRGLFVTVPNKIEVDSGGGMWYVIIPLLPKFLLLSLALSSSSEQFVLELRPLLGGAFFVAGRRRTGNLTVAFRPSRLSPLPPSCARPPGNAYDLDDSSRTFRRHRAAPGADTGPDCWQAISDGSHPAVRTAGNSERSGKP
jgi:hypothetical protein